MAIDLTSMNQRRWYFGADGIKRWADTDERIADAPMPERLKKELLWRLNDITEMLQERGVSGLRIYGCDEWSAPVKNLKAAVALIEEQSVFDDEQMRDALDDCVGALLYIRQHHGELYGVAFDRALDKAHKALAATGPQK